LFCISVAEEEGKETTEGMEISTRSKDTASTERMAQKRKMPSPSHSSNGHSSAETSPCPMKKKKKPGAVSSSKDQVTIKAKPQSKCKQKGRTSPTPKKQDYTCKHTQTADYGTSRPSGNYNCKCTDMIY
uniref:Uncharacterized protein n=1 Tax=Seriola lalandi dorsalis TaxID=1841481 RepID=A0A3B4XYU6_SERLL